MVNHADAARIAASCADAYSADRYASWAGCARLLARRGYDAREIEALLRSKHLRWAGDVWGGAGNYGRLPVKALGAYLDRERTPSESLAPGSPAMVWLVADTFGPGGTAVPS